MSCYSGCGYAYPPVLGCGYGYGCGPLSAYLPYGPCGIPPCGPCGYGYGWGRRC